MKELKGELWDTVKEDIEALTMQQLEDKLKEMTKDGSGNAIFDKVGKELQARVEEVVKELDIQQTKNVWTCPWDLWGLKTNEDWIYSVKNKFPKCDEYNGIISSIGDMMKEIPDYYEDFTTKTKKLIEDTTNPVLDLGKQPESPHSSQAMSRLKT